jgi:ParB/RepB/Spo0J family partition protein
MDLTKGNDMSKTKTIELPARAIVLDHSLNVRKDYLRPKKGERGQQELDDDELRESIRQHGLLQAPRVCQRGKKYYAVYGFRRIQACRDIDPDMVIRCSLIEAPKEKAQLTILAMVENCKRKNLRPHELADAIYQCRTLDPSLTMRELAQKIGISRPHCSNLYQIRKGADPFLWELFVRHGDTVRFDDMLAVTKLPKGQQVEAWKKAHARRPTRKKNGAPARRPTRTRIETYLEQTEEYLEETRSREKKVYARGVLHGLAVALGTEKPIERGKST